MASSTHGRARSRRAHRAGVDVDQLVARRGARDASHDRRRPDVWACADDLDLVDVEQRAVGDAPARPPSTTTTTADRDEPAAAAALRSRLDLVAAGLDAGVDARRRRRRRARARGCGAHEPSTSGRGSEPADRRRAEADQAGLGREADAGVRPRPGAAPRAIRATMSSAEPPSSAWMKLACLGDTSAVPMPQALAPGGVDQPTGRVARRVGEHRAGVGAAGLVLAPPAHDLGDRRPRTGARSPGASAQLGRARTTWCGAERRSGGSRGRERRRAPVHPRPPRRSSTRTLTSARGHVRAVPAGVHPHRAADRAGHADGPLEPGEPGRRGAAGHHRQAGRAAGASPRSPSMSIVGERARPARPPDPAKPGVGDQQVRAPADDQHRHRRWPATASATQAERRRRRRPDEQRGGAADPVGGERRRAGRRGSARAPSSAAARSTDRRRAAHAARRPGRGSAPAPRRAARSGRRPRG